MPTSNFNFKKANLADNPNFPKASSDNYNENLDLIDSILSDEFFSGTISTSLEEVVDQINVVDNPSCYWLLSLRETTNNKNSFLSIQAVSDGTEVSFVKIHTPLNRVDFLIDVDLDSGNLRLKVTNNEVETIKVSGRRMSPFIKTNF